MKKAGNLVRNIDLYISSICIFAIVAITLFAIVMRYIVGTPIQWSEELSLAIMVCFTFLGSSYAFKDNEHISIDLITNRLSKNLNRVFFILRQGIILFIVGYVFVYLGSKLALQAKDKVTTVLNIPYTVIDATVVLGGIIAIVRVIYNFKKIDVRNEDY